MQFSIDSNRSDWVWTPDDEQESDPTKIGFEEDHLRILFDAQEWALAEKAAQYLLQTNPSTQVLFYLATCHYHLKNDEEAIHFYLKFVMAHETISDCLFQALKNLGNLFLRSADIETAEEWYQKAYRICPQSDTILVNLGVLHTQTKSYNSALDFFRQAVVINPANDSGWIGLALIHWELSDFDLARANLRQALDLNPSSEIGLQLARIWQGM